LNCAAKAWFGALAWAKACCYGNPQTDRESNVLLVILIGVHLFYLFGIAKKNRTSLCAPGWGFHPSIPVAAKGTLAVAPSALDRAVGAPPARQGCWSCYALVMARTSAKKAPEDGEGEVVRVVTIW